MSELKAKSGPISVAYVEVNRSSLLNVGRYQLTGGSNVFDIAVIFAANIDLTDGKPTFYSNEHVQALLNHAETQIRPLQARGIIVIISLLGNWQGAGISNFASPSAALDFAKQVRAVVDGYGLDGVDMDDEYAEYGKEGTPPENANSIGWFISALRQVMPTKLITFYNFGPAAGYLQEASPQVGELLDYSWNSQYGTFEPPQIPGLSASKLSAAAVKLSETPDYVAQSLAEQTVQGKYGVFLTYDLTDGDHSQYISAFSWKLYDQASKYVGSPEDIAKSDWDDGQAS